MSRPAIQRMLGYENHRVNQRLSYFTPRHKKAGRTFAEEIASGLQNRPRSINPKFFYDDLGSRLFESICGLPEYYLTRTETDILGRIGGELGGFLAGDTRLVELGSGSSLKTRLILDAFAGVQDHTEYLPIDISDILRGSCLRLLGEYPRLHVTGIIDTYDGGLELVRGMGRAPSLIAFLGSSLGNFDADDGRALLGRIRSSMGDGDLFLLGIDMVKPAHILEAAYDDQSGVTARFNLNVLARINRELGGDFDLMRFAHVARFNEPMQRVEMHLESLEAQTVAIPGAGITIHLGAGELIHTENSYKYTVRQIREQLAGAGFGIRRIWQDDDGYYTLVLCSRG